MSRRVVIPSLLCITLAIVSPGVSSVVRAAAPSSSSPSAPSLVVVLVVDQLRGGMLEAIQPQLKGGFRRLLESGRRFSRCHHDHSGTETGPGHATLLSGAHPSHNGIILNDWHDRDTQRGVYCAGPAAPDAPTSFDGGVAISSAFLTTESLADSLRRAQPAARIFTVSGKDRAAALTAGRGANGVFWLSPRTGVFTSHPFFMESLPAWGAEFWGLGTPSAVALRTGLPEEWTYPIRPAARADDYPFEGHAYSRTSPHPIMQASAETLARDVRNRQLAARIFTSPWVDWMTLELARRILKEEQLGRDTVPDLLVIGLTATDTVGHQYGPGSQEHLDHLLRLDGWLEEFMKEAGAAASGHGRGVLYALSADHGVMDIPETRPGLRRVDEELFKDRFEEAMTARLGKGPFLEAMHGTHLYLDRRTLERLRQPLEKAIDEARKVLSTFWEVDRVYRASDLLTSGGGDPMLDLHRHSFTPERGGDIVLVPCEGCLFSTRGYGTSHGTPWEYDRHVPMILSGAGILPGVVEETCRTIDLAPTLSQILGIQFDSPRDGRPLPLSAVDTVHSRQ